MILANSIIHNISFRNSQNFKFHITWVKESCDPPEWAWRKMKFHSTTMWLILDGTKSIQIGDDKFIGQPGDLIVIPPNVKIKAERSEASNELHRLSIGVHAKIGFSDIATLYNFPCHTNILAHRNFHLIKTNWLKLIDAYNLFYSEINTANIHEHQLISSMEYGHKFILMQNQFFQFFTIIFETLKKDFAESEIFVDQRLELACDYIRANLEHKPTVTDIANSVYLSESHLRLLFRNYFGMSPMTYLRKTRMEVAKELLSSTDLSIKTISEKVGFNDQSEFSRAFRQSEELSPLQYRQICRF